MTIQAVIFDVGGVMLRTHTHHFRHRWDERLGLPPGTVEETVFNSPLGTAAQLGQVTTDDHWRALQTYLGLDDTAVAELRHDFWAGDQFDFELVAWIRSLRSKSGLTTAIISNAFDDLRSVLTEEFAVGDAFDLIVVSSEEGVMKPHPEIYRRTLERLHCRPEQALFIDDNQANITGAEAVGIHGVLYTAGMNLGERLAPFLSD